MTDQEQNTILLAERVMGWEVHGDDRKNGPGRWVTPLDGIHPVLNIGGDHVPQWNPYKSIADAWMLVERIRERRWWLKLLTPWSSKDAIYHASLIKFGMVDGANSIYGNGTTECEAICAAALRSISEGKSE